MNNIYLVVRYNDYGEMSIFNAYESRKDAEEVIKSLGYNGYTIESVQFFKSSEK